MINRELLTLTVVTFQDGVDAYGQKRQTQASTRTIQGVVKKYQNKMVETPKFNDVEYIVLTQDRDVRDTNLIVIGTDNYDVLYVIPSFRYNQLFLRKQG